MKIKDRIIVAAADLSRHGDHAILEGLAQLASGAAILLHVVHVLEPDQFVEMHGRPSIMEQQERALVDGPALLRQRVQFDATMNDVQYPIDRVRVHVRIGHAVETLLQATVDFDADCLIVGTHGRTGLSRIILGSVAEQLLRRAHCPVVIARPKNYQGLAPSKAPELA